MKNQYDNFDNKEDFREEFRTELKEQTRRHARQKKSRRRQKMVRKIGGIAMAAVLFGSVASGTSYAINSQIGSSTSTLAASSTNLTTNDGTTTSGMNLTTTEDNTTDSDLLNTAATDSQSLNVSTIASQGLTSVVSVTNISVQAVENYFDRYGRGGMGGMGNMGGGSMGTQTQETTSVGSGVIIYSDDSSLYMVTNYHVVEDATTLSVTFVDDSTYEATLCGYDSDRDIAVIKVVASDLSTDTQNSISIATVGSSDDLTVGEQVVAIGNALGYGQSVTTGIVSALDRTVDSDSSSNSYLQTDAAINPGNSGGALFNMSGQLVGINTAKISTTGVEGMGYAIPISEVLDLIGSMIEQ